MSLDWVALTRSEIAPTIPAESVGSLHETSCPESTKSNGTSGGSGSRETRFTHSARRDALPRRGNEEKGVDSAIPALKRLERREMRAEGGAVFLSDRNSRWEKE